MERLQPRNENQGGSAMSLAKKLLKIAFWCFVVGMGLVGLWFTLAWQLPQELAVEQTIQSTFVQQEITVEFEVSGTLSHYRLGNQPDVFRGTIEGGGETFQVTVEYAPGREFGFYRSSDQGFRVLLSRDGKNMLLQDADGNLLMAPDAPEQFQSWRELLLENEEWARQFDFSDVPEEEK